VNEARHRTSYAWAALPLFASLGLLPECGDSEEQFASMCEIASEIQADKTVAPIDKGRRFNERCEKELSGHALTAVQATGGASTQPDVRYGILEATAKDEGLSDWSCEPMKKMFDAEALAGLHQDCKKGIARHCLILGKSYQLGDLTAKDPKLAKRYIDRACKLGNPLACDEAKKLPK
jgi:TPR repeat protein